MTRRLMDFMSACFAEVIEGLEAADFVAAFDDGFDRSLAYVLDRTQAEADGVALFIAHRGEGPFAGV